jgi:hypothetical protein
LLPAYRASSGPLQAFPLAKNEAAFPAFCRDDLQSAPEGMEGVPQMLKVAVNHFFRDADPHGNLTGGKGYASQQIGDLPADGG